MNWKHLVVLVQLYPGVKGRQRTRLLIALLLPLLLCQPSFSILLNIAPVVIMGMVIHDDDDDDDNSDASISCDSLFHSICSNLLHIQNLKHIVCIMI